MTNFSGNAVATVVIAKWVGELDRERAKAVLSGREPFDEATMLDDIEAPELAEHPVRPGHPKVAAISAQATTA